MPLGDFNNDFPCVESGLGIANQAF
jgi:hypothetical protein